jgi:hypothetical protein
MLLLAAAVCGCQSLPSSISNLAALDRPEEEPQRPSASVRADLEPGSGGSPGGEPERAIWRADELIGDVVRNQNRDSIDANPLAFERAIVADSADMVEPNGNDVAAAMASLASVAAAGHVSGDAIDVGEQPRDSAAVSPVGTTIRFASLAPLAEPEPTARQPVESADLAADPVELATPNEADGVPFESLAACESDRAADVAQTMKQLYEMLRRAHRVDGLRVTNPRLCQEVRGLGDLEPFTSPRFVAGDDVLVYCEVGNHAVAPRPRDAQPAHQTRFSGGLVFLDSQGAIVGEIDFGPVDSLSSHATSNSFVVFSTKIPDLQPGRYRLVLVISDELGRQLAASDTPLEFAIEERPASLGGQM